jgi:hypothetical protein
MLQCAPTTMWNVIFWFDVTPVTTADALFWFDATADTPVTKATCADANGYLDGSVGDNFMVHGLMPLGWIT